MPKAYFPPSGRPIAKTGKRATVVRDSTPSTDVERRSGEYCR